MKKKEGESIKEMKRDYGLKESGEPQMSSASRKGERGTGLRIGGDRNKTNSSFRLV